MMMSMVSVPLSLFFSVFVLILHNADAFNITEILNKNGDFATFNSFLTQTNLADEINKRQTITVLAVENSNLGSLSGKPMRVVKNILSVHIILDYYDAPKLQKLTNGSTLLTTLFQTSGLAKGQQGFVNVTHVNADTIAFSSAVPGSNSMSNLVRTVASDPYDLSVLQISNAIIPQGMDTGNSPAPHEAPAGQQTPPPPPPPPPATPGSSPHAAPTKAPPKPSAAPPTPSQATAPPTPSKATPPSKQSQAPAPSKAPSNASAAPTKAATPTATAGSPPVPNAPSADVPTADAPAEATVPASDTTKPSTPSAGTTLHIGLAAVFTMVLSSLSLASGI